MANSYLDLEGLTLLSYKVKSLLSNKVDKVDGKGLSTNDYTTNEKTKLKGIDTGAEVNKIDTIQVNGTSQTPTNKVVNIKVPEKTSDISNDSNFVTDASYVHTDNNYTTTEKTKLAGIDEGANKYVLPKANSTTLGGIKIGTNLSIADDGTVSAKDTTYSAATTSANGLMSSADKKKLDGIDTEAQVNVIESIKVNGTAQTITSKAVDITVPTNNNQLTNGAGYQTADDVSSAISSAIADITGIEFKIVTSLPTTGVNGTIYLISNNGSNNNIYDEYIYVNSKWEKIGSTDVDLSDYLKKTDMVAITNSEIDSLFE